MANAWHELLASLREQAERRACSLMADAFAETTRASLIPQTAWTAFCAAHPQFDATRVRYVKPADIRWIVAKPIEGTADD